MAGPERMQPPSKQIFGDAVQAVPESVQCPQNRVVNLGGAIKLACVTPEIMGSKSFHGVKWLCLSPCNPPQITASAQGHSTPLTHSALLQVVTNRDTQETLLCIAFVFEVSTSEHGAQHHVYKLVKD